MSWQKFEHGGQSWEVNPDGLFALIRAAESARLIRAYSNKAPQMDTKLGVLEVVTDFERVNQELRTKSEAFYRAVLNDLPNQPENALRNLVIMVDQTRADKNWFANLRRQTMAQNALDIDAQVARLGKQITALKTLRDFSIVTLLVIATASTGGAAAAGSGALVSGTQWSALSLGSGLKGYATYQDTGNVGAAMISASATFTTTLIGMGPFGSGGQQAAIIAIQSTRDGVMTGLQAHIEGKKFDTAIRQAVLATGVSLATGGLGMRINRIAVPVDIKVQINSAVGFAGSRLVDASGREAAPPAEQPSPKVFGAVTQSGLPANSGEAVTFLKNNVLRQM